MNENYEELIEDLIIIYFTKQGIPNSFEVETIERAMKHVEHRMDRGTWEANKHWIEKFKID